jgi:hypothetical protein
MYIKLEIKQDYTTMHGQPVIKIYRKCLRIKLNRFRPVRIDARGHHFQHLL